MREKPAQLAEVPSLLFGVGHAAQPVLPTPVPTTQTGRQAEGRGAGGKGRRQPPGPWPQRSQGAKGVESPPGGGGMAGGLGRRPGQRGPVGAGFWSIHGRGVRKGPPNTPLIVTQSPREAAAKLWEPHGVSWVRRPGLRSLRRAGGGGGGGPMFSWRWRPGHRHTASPVTCPSLPPPQTAGRSRCPLPSGERMRVRELFSAHQSAVTPRTGPRGGVGGTWRNSASAAGTAVRMLTPRPSSHAKCVTSETASSHPTPTPAAALLPRV